MRLYLNICFVVLLAISNSPTNGLHLNGKFKTQEFFKFLTRFGFQSTDVHNADTTQGYIYGNITLVPSSNVRRASVPLLALTILEKADFLDFYKKTSIKPRDYACSIMFDRFLQQTYDSKCNPNGTLDSMRKVPCISGQTCDNQYKYQNEIVNSQFMFQISDSNEAKFLYISLVACERDNETCKWYGSIDNDNELTKDYEISYSIYLTNGNPSFKTVNRFEHQFTYELFDVFEIYMCSMLVYLFILPFIVYRLYENFHIFYLLLSSYIVTEICSRFMFFLHNLVFAYNGIGVNLFDSFGWLFEVIATSILVLILLLLAKGFAITTKYIKAKKQFFFVWSILSTCSIVSHMVALSSFNIIFQTNYYETYAGYLELCLRIVFMIWYLKELKKTFGYINLIRTNASKKQVAQPQQQQQNGHLTSDTTASDRPLLNEENNSKNSDDNVEIEFISQISSSILNSNRLNLFYLHFGACSLVWFIYLPILVFISSLVSDLFRLRLMLSIRYFVNIICVIMLIYTMWSSKTPLVLPGKIASNELSNTQYFFDLLYNQSDDDDDDEDDHFDKSKRRANMSTINEEQEEEE